MTFAVRRARLTTRDDAQGRVEIYGFDLIIWQWPFMNFFVQAGGAAVG